MLLPIANVLDSAKLAEAQEMLALLTWRDGADTAGKTAREVKRNLQADLSTRSGAKLKTLLNSAVQQHPTVKAAAQPRQFSKLLLSKTETGGGYGLHVDNSYMPTGNSEIRTDLSFTLFLSPPDAYEGGELEIQHAGQAFSIKLAAGDLILYPSTNLHQVKPVQSGTRLVCVGWIESRVKRSEDRELLYELSTLKAALAQQYPAQSPEMLKLSRIQGNLKRRFS